jgi:hypothetical protein
MKSITWLLTAITGLMLAFAVDPSAIGQQPAAAQPLVTDLPVNQATSYKGEEFLLMGNAERGAGEPVITISRKNPNIILVGAMANDNYVEGEKWTVGVPFSNWESVRQYRNTTGASISEYAISHDRGRTWKFFFDPFRDYFRMNGTADAFVGTGKDGTLFIGAMNFFPQDASPLMLSLEKEPRPGLLYGNAEIAWSTDEGKTWNTPQHVMGQATPREEYSPDAKPNLLGKTPYDRPFLVTDESTGTIYVPGNGTGGDTVHQETFIRASDDNGRTWGLIDAYDSPDYPEGGMAARPAAANGVLGVAYIASSVPPGGGKCPCVVFGASRDEGKTFERRVVESDTFVPHGFYGMGSPALAADPGHPGRFAVLSVSKDNSQVVVYVTDDNGQNWKGPIIAGSVPGTAVRKPDIGYSPKGDLGVMWLAAKPDATYTCWSNALRDGRTTFGKQIEVSESSSPSRESIKHRGNNWDGDDLSSIAVDDDSVHIVWADGRAGFLGAWYARVPLTSYF